MASTRGPVTEGRRWQRHRRGRHAVLICPGRWIQNPSEPCPYTVVISEPGHEHQEPAAVEAAGKHWTENHAGLWGDAQRAHTGGVVDLSELKARAE